MYEMIIFAIVLYDVSSGNYREEVVIKIKELYRFNNNNLPF
jgi:hypothetical protein